jgi:hypothetical protein
VGKSPVMADGKAVAARPSRLGFRGNVGDARPSRAPGGSRECSGRAMGHWFSSGASGARSSPAALMAGGDGWLGCSGTRGKEERKGFIDPGTRRGGSTSPSWSTGAREWARRRWRRAAEPAANGAWRFARQRVRTGRVAPA